jgi:hypothetical protein
LKKVLERIIVDRDNLLLFLFEFDLRARVNIFHAKTQSSAKGAKKTHATIVEALAQ